MMKIIFNYLHLKTQEDKMDSFVHSLNVFPHFQILLKNMVKNFLFFVVKEKAASEFY